MKPFLFVVLALAALAPVRPAAGQEGHRNTLWGMGGTFWFDLSGTGEAAVGALRADYGLSRYVLAEVGLGYTYTRQQFGHDVPYLFPELQLQAQLPLGALRPYVGIGGAGFLDLSNERTTPYYSNGYVTYWSDDENRNELAFTASGGVRAFVTDHLGLRLELRVRAIGCCGTGTDIAGGLGWRF